MKLPKRRRIENKTDYHKRLKLLKSNRARIIIRRTNRYILGQCVTSTAAQDSVVLSVSSKDLVALGWPKEAHGSLKSIPAAYLTGYLLGMKINESKIENPIIDLGMARIIHKNRLFAVLKGLIDAEVAITCDEEDLPSEERILGKHLKKDMPKTIEKIKGAIDKQ